MSGIIALCCEAYVGIKILKGVYKIGEKFGEAKAIYKFGKDIKRIHDDVNKESE